MLNRSSCTFKPHTTFEHQPKDMIVHFIKLGLMRPQERSQRHPHANNLLIQEIFYMFIEVSTLSMVACGGDVV